MTVDERNREVKLLGLQTFDDDKRLLGTTYRQSEARTLLWDLSWSDSGPELTNVRAYDGHWQFAEDGKVALEVTGKPNPVRLWDTSNGEPKLIQEFPDIHYGFLSANGSRIAGVPQGGNTNLFVFSFQSERWDQQKFDVGANIASVTITKDGNHVAVGCLDSCVRMFDFSKRIGREINPPAPFTRIRSVEVSFGWGAVGNCRLGWCCFV